MSSPSINRWGLNLFWYRYWYSDTNYQLNIQCDEIFNKLIYYYLFYGIIFPKNIFFNKYWYNFKFNIKTNININHNKKYYRFVEFKNEFTKEKILKKFRIKMKFLYFSKIWIFKYQNWLILNFYVFQPLKQKNIKILKNKIEINFFKKKNTNNKIFFKSLFYFIFYNFNFLQKNNFYYF